MQTEDPGNWHMEESQTPDGTAHVPEENDATSTTSDECEKE